jgi:hypothetical protein
MRCACWRPRTITRSSSPSTASFGTMAASPEPAPPSGPRSLFSIPPRPGCCPASQSRDHRDGRHHRRRCGPQRRDGRDPQRMDGLCPPALDGLESVRRRADRLHGVRLGHGRVCVEAKPAEAAGSSALERDAMRRNRLVVESCSRFKRTVEPVLSRLAAAQPFAGRMAELVVPVQQLRTGSGRGGQNGRRRRIGAGCARRVAGGLVSGPPV